MSGKEKKTSRKESTNSELQQSLMVLKTQIDEIGLSIQKQIDSAPIQERINSSLQKQIDSIVSHLVTMKKEFLENPIQGDKCCF